MSSFNYCKEDGMRTPRMYSSIRSKSVCSRVRTTGALRIVPLVDIVAVDGLLYIVLVGVEGTD